jgi:hypothetical protein
MSAKLKRSLSVPTALDGRPFKLLHQSLILTDVNFKKQIIRGHTILSILPTTSTNKIWKLPLNCKQCRILID